MADTFKFSEIVSDKASSPLEGTMVRESVATESGAVSVQISEVFGRCICEMAAWPDARTPVRRLVPKNAIAFECAPARWLVISEDTSTSARLNKKVGDKGTVVDLSHGRTIIQVSGDHSIWVLSKLFAIDFAAMPAHSGLSTSHHGITAQIWHDDENTFQIIVFRSLAESFFEALKTAGRDVGYEIL